MLSIVCCYFEFWGQQVCFQYFSKSIDNQTVVAPVKCDRRSLSGKHLQATLTIFNNQLFIHCIGNACTVPPTFQFCGLLVLLFIFKAPCVFCRSGSGGGRVTHRCSWEMCTPTRDALPTPPRCTRRQARRGGP